jgi:hypothetical protein
MPKARFAPVTIKEQLLQEIESTPNNLLVEVLDFLRFLKTKPNLKTEESQKYYRPASGRSILRYAGKWEGDDLEDCLQQVYATRGKAKFDRDLNPYF